MRYTLGALLGLMVMGLLAGCGNSKGPDYHPPATPNQQIQEIQNNPNMPPAVKEQAIAGIRARMGTPPAGAGAPGAGK